MNGMLFAFVGFSVLVIASYVVGWLIMRGYEKKGHAYE
jgi:phage shock protein PspC (stress-responsive transcriptional regulator)